MWQGIPFSNARKLKNREVNMPQQEKITRRLDYDKRAEIKGVRILQKTANYSVDQYVDSGSYIAANNSSQRIYFNLPPVNAVNGHYWNFFARNTGRFQVVGDTNAIVDDFGVSKKAINFGVGIEGEGCRIICDGVKYFVVGLSQTNATYGFGYQDG